MCVRVIVTGGDVDVVGKTDAHPLIASWFRSRAQLDSTQLLVGRGGNHLFSLSLSLSFSTRPPPPLLLLLRRSFVGFFLFGFFCGVECPRPLTASSSTVDVVPRRVLWPPAIGRRRFWCGRCSHLTKAIQWRSSVLFCSCFFCCFFFGLFRYRSTFPFR